MSKPAAPAAAAPAAAAAAKPVPETVLKAKKSLEQRSAERAATRATLRKKKTATRRTVYKRAEQYAVEYKKAAKNEVRLKRLAKNSGSYYVEPEAKLALVIRIRGINGVAPRTRKILQLLRLRQLHNATFIKVNKATNTLLQMVAPYITFGYPNLKTVRELVLKRGYGKVSGSRIALTDNKVIEEHLGKFDVLSVEDVIHEIVTVGPHFKEVNKFLWPFKLSSPKGGFVKKRVSFIEGGDAGNREEHINELVRKMN